MKFLIGESSGVAARRCSRGVEAYGPALEFERSAMTRYTFCLQHDLSIAPPDRRPVAFVSETDFKAVA
jgi:hypothetical protein